MKLSVIPKVFEKLVTSRLANFIKSVDSPHHYGFMNGKSTITNVLELICHISKSFKDSKQILYIYTSVRRLVELVMVF